MEENLTRQSWYHGKMAAQWPFWQCHLSGLYFGTRGELHVPCEIINSVVSQTVNFCRWITGSRRPLNCHLEQLLSGNRAVAAYGNST